MDGSRTAPHQRVRAEADECTAQAVSHREDRNEECRVSGATGLDQLPQIGRDQHAARLGPAVRPHQQPAVECPERLTGVALLLSQSAKPHHSVRTSITSFPIAIAVLSVSWYNRRLGYQKERKASDFVCNTGSRPIDSAIERSVRSNHFVY
jgi:hypothetical protein